MTDGVGAPVALMNGGTRAAGSEIRHRGEPPELSAAEGRTERLERLRQASEDMEGVFVGYLTRALRATVPDGGHPDAPGADLYGQLLDEHLAQSVVKDTRSGIADALYRQLAARFISPQGEGEG